MNILKIKLLWAAVALVAITFVTNSMMWQLNPRHQALVLQLGQIVEVVNEPGLHFKKPFINDVRIFDRRLLDLDIPVLKIYTVGKKAIEMDAFARYRIDDPVKFFTTVQDIDNANGQLAKFLASGIREVAASNTLTAIVRDNREELMNQIQEIVNKKSTQYGIVFSDVKIKKADLPDANVTSIHKRMASERKREATEIRANGEEQAKKTRSKADRDVRELVSASNKEAVVIVDTARGDAERIRGEGDAERERIFAEAYGKNPDFFDFYRSLESYKESLRANNTTLVINSAEDDYFSFLSSMDGKSDQ